MNYVKKVILLSGLTLVFGLAPAQGGDFELYQPIMQYQADRGALERKYTLRESLEYFERMDRLDRDWLDRLEEFDFQALSPEARVDFLLLRNLLQKSLYFNGLKRREFERVSWVTEFAAELYVFVRDRRRGKTVAGSAEAARFNQAAAGFRQAARDLQGKKPFSSPRQAERAAALVRDLRENLAEAFSFYNGYHPDFSWWAGKPYESLLTEMQAYEKLLPAAFATTRGRDDGSGIIGIPEGRDNLVKLLQFEFIPYSPQELLAVGEREFQWCRGEMLAAAREMGHAEDWRAALEAVKNAYLPPGEQPALINRLAEEAIAFISDNDLLTIPELARETWRMRMMSPERQLVNPFFTGGETISISYPTATMDHQAKMMSLRGNNPHFCKATVHHELIAGHHLQAFMNQRHKPYRRLLGTPFWLEGWALYWEFLLYEMGYPATPQDRLGFLFWRKHRAARIIFSLKYHLGQMSPGECIDFLVNEVGHERANAEAEVRRSFSGGYDPLYQLAYMIGGIQFRALKEELVDGGRLSLKEFHDAVLRRNNMPLEMLRLILRGEQPARDHVTCWRFLN